MRLFQRGDVPHIDDGFGEVRPLREDEAQVLALSSAALAEPDPEVEALLAPTVAPLMNTWRRALALSAVGGDIDAAELDAAATELAKAASDPAAMRGYLDTLSGSARAWRRTLQGHTEDLAKAQRWITAHPNGPGSRGIPLLIESTGGGPARIIGGAGGKLNGQELGKLKPGAGGAAPNTREAKSDAAGKATRKDLPKSRHGVADAYAGHEPPADLVYKGAASRFMESFHRMRRESDQADGGVSEQQIDEALKKQLNGKLDMRNADERALKQWADAFTEAAAGHRPATEDEVKSLRDAEQAESDAAAKAKETARTKAQADKYERRNKEIMAAQPKRIAMAEKQKASNAPWPRSQADEAWKAIKTHLWVEEAPAGTLEKLSNDDVAHFASVGLQAAAHKADDRADEAEKTIASMKNGPGVIDQRRLEREQASLKEYRNEAERKRQLATRIVVQGMPPEPGKATTTQQRLFKSRLIIPIPARLAKSTLAPVATPAQRVMVSDRPAFWREANGRGVLQIPLDTGKDLLVLASDLALALVEGADELARVLSGMAPARALIAKLGIHKTARKPA